MKMDLKKLKTGLTFTGVTALTTMTALATPVIDNDTIQGMPQLGSDLGDFMGNLAPGLGKFILIMAIFGGIAAILYGVFLLIKKVGINGRR